MNCYEKTALRERLVQSMNKLAGIEALIDYSRTRNTRSPETIWLQLRLTREFFEDLYDLAEFSWRAENMGHPSREDVYNFLQIDVNQHYHDRKSRRLSELLEEAGEEN